MTGKICWALRIAYTVDIKQKCKNENINKWNWILTILKPYYRKLLNIKRYLPFCNLSATIHTSEKLIFYCFNSLPRQFTQILSGCIVFIITYICCIPRFSYKKFEEIKRLLRTIKTLQLAKSLLDVIYVLTKCIKEATLFFWYLLNKSLHFITFFMMRQYVMKKILFLRISFLGSPQHFLHFGS